MIEGRVLLIDDDDNLRRVTRVNLERSGFHVRDADGGKAGLEAASAESFDVVVTDLAMPDLTGLDVLEAMQREHPETAVVLVTGFGTVETAVQAMKIGAFDYLTKPFDREELVLVLKKAMKLDRLERENRILRETGRIGREVSMVAESPSMQHVMSMLGQVAPTDASVLILGESGTGKELVARFLHEKSPRCGSPMVVVNCAAIPENLMESHLFGHRKGAFTGATEDREGYFQAADNGTIFLDEIGELRQDLQARLLRALETGEVQRVGDTKIRHVNVRILAATNRDVAAGVREGWFREDLYYRLNVITVSLPPLRKRREDIEPLVRTFLSTAGPSSGHPPELSREAMERLRAYRWPGNIRELRNVMERALILSGNEAVGLEHLPPLEGSSLGDAEDSELFIRMPRDGLDLETVEKTLIRKALERFDGNQSRAARYLSITRPTLLYRMEKYGLKTLRPG